MGGDALTDALAAEARAAGFAAIGVCRPDAAADRTAPRLSRWLAEGRQGDMGWMAARAAWRGDPTALWPEARSVVMLADSYSPNGDPLEALQRPSHGAISVYAQGRDYHDVVKKRLKRIGRWLIGRAGGEIKVFVDTAPVMEKPLAEAAGLGWQGKHTNLLGRDLGGWFFLGAIFTTLDLAPSAPGRDHCGSCRKCLDICPTAAFDAAYRLDPRRCISYLTIEHKGPIPRGLRPAMGNRIYGCDDCLAICPWNKFAQKAGDAAHHARAELAAPPLDALAALDEAGFREVFAGSPIKRTGRARFVRNVLVAIGNSGAPELAAAAEARLADPEPLVRGAAVWALSRLRDAGALAALARDDPDPEVAEEWRLGLAEARARAPLSDSGVREP